MNLHRQEDQAASRVADFQQDEKGSDSEDSTSAASRRTIKHLRIHLDMATTQYLTPSAHHQVDGLPGSSNCSSGPSAIAYTSSSDLDPYSAVRQLKLPNYTPPQRFSDSPYRQASGVSSFNYPATTDSTLLTPVSSAGSPPLQQRPSAKSMRVYHPSQSAVAGPQGPTPPNTSKLYYSNYDINASSQSSSPMAIHPQVTEAGPYDMATYIAQSPPNGHHPSSPKAEIPPPIDPYLGHFTVSGGNDTDVSHHPFSDYHHSFGNVEVDPNTQFMVRHPSSHVPVSTPQIHHRMPSSGAPTPLLGQPHPSQFRQQTMRVGGIEDLRDPGMLPGNNYPSHTSLSPGRRIPPRKKPATTRKASRTPKASPHGGNLDGQNGTNGHMDENDRDELTLRDDAPDDDKYLFQLRKEFISEKGKGMWEEMKAKYSEKHQGNWEKAALQMKVSRAVAKFGVWPKREIERLQEAHRYYEEKRYQLILARMKENGGCKVWDWKPQHIEAMLVKLGMEEATVDEKTGTRRRKNKAARRRASSQNGGHHLHHPSSVMNDWSNGLGLHPAFQGHAHHVVHAAATRQASFDMLSDEASVAPTFSSEQENEYLDQIFNKVKSEGSLSPELMELTYADDEGRSQSQDIVHHHSERVARQACEQLMQQQQQPSRIQEHAYAAQ
ncbi:hypothetical protein B0H66DRAFT_541303 [Apodospora peruviana]|uniref:Uncharacterized protein n=1 Tax=Apodospora peruviana TaxID=516989 RepID=A0AAE0MER7_9PEZI|nr:hypothetical protein B0H66DRAFT_541303 [Apodospora peruviana]